MRISSMSKFADDVCNATGHRDAVSLQLNLGVEDTITVTLKKHLTVEEAKALSAALNQFGIEATQVRWAGEDNEEPR